MPEQIKNPILIQAKLRLKNSSLEELRIQFTELDEKRNALLASIDEVDKPEDLEPLENELEETDGELNGIEEQIASVEEEIRQLNDQLQQTRSKKPTLGGKGNVLQPTEIREKINAYIRSQGQVRDGLKQTDLGILIPKDTLSVIKTPKTTINLKAYTDVRRVSNSSGQIPVIERSNSTLVSQTELAKNPDLAKPAIKNVDYTIETYRGSLAISQEAIDDASIDLLALIEDDIDQLVENTEDAEIAKILKTATAHPAQGLDGLKDVLNKKLGSKWKNAQIWMTDSMYNALDKVKDKDGRYMLQPDVTSPTGLKFGKAILHTVPDTLLGNDSEMKAFVGDMKEFVLFADRVQVMLKWIDSEIYGQVLGVATRFDVTKKFEKAGFFVTYTDAA